MFSVLSADDKTSLAKGPVLKDVTEFLKSERLELWEKQCIKIDRYKIIYRQWLRRVDFRIVPYSINIFGLKYRGTEEL
jgi:hypothetical protein